MSRSRRAKWVARLRAGHLDHCSSDVATVLDDMRMTYEPAAPQGRNDMARKPKANQGTAPDAPVAGDKLTPGGEAPVSRRGRRPKSATASPEEESSVESEAPSVGARADDSASLELVSAPTRRRPGPKPKQRDTATAAAPLLNETAAKRGRKPRQSTPIFELSTAAADAAQSDDAAHPDGSGSTDPVGVDDAAATSGEQPASMMARNDQAGAAKPAAHWEQSTETAKFDWIEIERTAAQPGPNQVMAKLLIAARAEGANSRWPL